MWTIPCSTCIGCVAHLCPWLLFDSRGVALSRSSAPTFTTLPSLKPLYFNGLRNALRFSDTVEAYAPGIQEARIRCFVHAHSL